MILGLDTAYTKYPVPLGANRDLRQDRERIPVRLRNPILIRGTSEAGGVSNLSYHVLKYLLIDISDIMYQSIKVSAISLKPTKWDKASNAEKLEAFFVEAAKDSPQLILATEGVLEGYVVMDVIEGNATPAAMLDIAEPLDGDYVKRFRRLACQLKTCLCFGFAERCGTSVYNSAVFIDSNGEICGTYHKTQFAEGTHPSWNFNCIGETIRAFDTPFRTRRYPHLQ